MDEEEDPALLAELRKLELGSDGPAMPHPATHAMLACGGRESVSGSVLMQRQWFMGCYSESALV